MSRKKDKARKGKPRGERQRLRRQARDVEVQWRRGLPPDDRATVPGRDGLTESQHEERKRERVKLHRKELAGGSDAPRWTDPEAIERARADARREDRRRVAALDETVAPDSEARRQARQSKGPVGVLRKWREGGDLGPLEPWRLYFRVRYPEVDDEYVVGGVNPQSVAHQYGEDGEPRRRRRVVHGPVFDPVTIHDVPRSVRDWHVQNPSDHPEPLRDLPRCWHSAAADRWATELTEDQLENLRGSTFLCHGCREPFATHPRRISWEEARRRVRDEAGGLAAAEWYREGFGSRKDLTGRKLGYAELVLSWAGPTPCDWVDSNWYPINHVAGVLGKPPATIVAYCDALALPWARASGKESPGYLRADGFWGLAEAQANGIIDVPTSPPSKEVRGRRGRPTRATIGPGQVFGRDSDGGGGLRLLTEDLDRKTKKKRFWFCECLRCGTRPERSIRQDKITRCEVRSCGCLQKETRAQITHAIAENRARLRHRRDPTHPNDEE